MRATDLHFRNPRHANPPFHNKQEFLSEIKNKPLKFCQESRFKHGSIYDANALHSPRVGPSSYKTQTPKDLK